MLKANKKSWCLKPKQPKKHWGAKLIMVFVHKANLKKLQLLEHKLKQSELSSSLHGII